MQLSRSNEGSRPLHSLSFTRIENAKNSNPRLATDVDLAPFYWQTKRLNFHKHIADSGTRKRALKPLWNLNSFYLPLSSRGSVCTTVQDAAGHPLEWLEWGKGVGGGWKWELGPFEFSRSSSVQPTPESKIILMEANFNLHGCRRLNIKCISKFLLFLLGKNFLK